jgi:uncharacterized protein YuzE
LALPAAAAPESSDWTQRWLASRCADAGHSLFPRRHDTHLPGTDSLYIELKPQPGAETRLIADGLNVDLDEKGEVVGFDIDFASKRVDLTRLETVAPPLSAPNAA